MRRAQPVFHFSIRGSPGVDMGLIRILLALSVVSAHFSAHPFLKFVGGDTAVQAFFIISGFYIAMIFPGNYQNATSFWKSRFFRLYPVYLFCGLFAFGHPLESLQNLLALPPLGGLVVALTNSTLLFQDVTLFLEVRDGAVAFTPDFASSLAPLAQYLIVPQAWSLGLEISFYLIAPFIIHRPLYLVALLLLSLALRAVLMHYGLSHDPWSYRFFPTELALFLLGSLSYKFSQKMKESGWLPDHQGLALFLLALITLFILVFSFVPLEVWQKKIALYVLLAAAIPLVFNMTKDVSLDNFVGNLSYPVYCCHLVVLKWVSKLPGWKLYLKGTLPGTLLALLIVIGFAYLLYRHVELPFDNYRKRFKRAPAA
ncbi:acyltransferase [Pseudomonas sp. A-1]|nr:acyltransferase [Pseudomonas sp. A-1]